MSGLGLIRQVAVIGTGTMGAGIAAQVANSGVPVVLLDIVPDGAKDRNVLAKEAIARLLKTNPAPLMHKRNAKLITPSNIEDSQALLAECDWIIEAVVERVDIKQAVYGKIESFRKAGSIVSTNTSTLPLRVLTENMPESFKKDFLLTHFFNPPRYMRLLEITAGSETTPAVVERISDFADRQLGKGVVPVNDTPGFIANRIGVFWLLCAYTEAIEMGISIEEADAVLSKPLGIPGTGVFALLDMVGLDLMLHILSSMADALPKHDAFHRVYRKPEMIQRMVANGYTGRKGKGGFYRLEKKNGEKVKQAFDLKEEKYYDALRPKPAAAKRARKGGLRALFDHPSKEGKYARRVMVQTLLYATSLVPEVTDCPADIDKAVRLGYNWKKGPFELIDAVGASWLAEAAKSLGVQRSRLFGNAGGRKFYRIQKGVSEFLGSDGVYHRREYPQGVLRLADIKRRGRPVAANYSASLWDAGDGVLCLEFHSKMNSMDPLTLAMINTAVRIIPKRGDKALVIYNEGSNFSVGANIALVMVVAKLRLWPLVSWFLGYGQRALKALKYAPFPVVGAPSGMALGGGCEALLHCDAIQAHAETYTGLVEVGVGIIPGWGGCKEMLQRYAQGEGGAEKGPMPPVIKAFEAIGMATVAKSAEEARGLGVLRRGDGVTMNKDRLLADAKARALSMVDGYKPPHEEDCQFRLPGATARTVVSMALSDLERRGLVTPHDKVVSKALGSVLSGGETDITKTLTEDDLLTLERTTIVELARHPDTKARMSHMLKTGKPLRN